MGASCCCYKTTHSRLYASCTKAIAESTEIDRQASIGAGHRFREKLFFSGRPRQWPSLLGIDVPVFVQHVPCTSSGFRSGALVSKVSGSETGASTATGAGAIVVCFMMVAATQTMHIFAACQCNSAGVHSGLVYVSSDMRRVCEHLYGRRWRMYLESAFDM